LFFFILRWQSSGMVALFVPDHPETIAITLRASAIISWSLLVMPIGIISSMFFTALERAGSSLLVALSRGLVFTVIGLTLFPTLWGEFGIWITPVFAEVATIFVTVYLIFRWLAETKQLKLQHITDSLPQAE
jgi:Na+-driven multidrug efflux pump